MFRKVKINMQQVSRTNKSTGIKLNERKSGGNRFYEQNQFVPRTKSPCKTFHKQSSFTRRQINEQVFRGVT